MGETANTYPVIAINSNEDIIEIIRLLLDNEGIPSIGRHVIDFKKGRQDLVTFMKASNPR